MSNINNHGVGMNNTTFPEFSDIAVKELNDEVAANCSGGIVSDRGPNPDIVLYTDGGLTGNALRINATTGDGPTNLAGYSYGALGLSSYNDKVSSFVILNGKWNFYADANYKGLYNTKPLGPGSYPNLPAGFANDSLSSLKRVG